MNRDGLPYGGPLVSDELPHDYGQDPLWQESVVLCWWDYQNGIGGFQRIGHEPHFEGGSAFISSFVCTRSGERYRRFGSTVLQPQDRLRAFRFSNTYEMTFPGRAHWTIRDERCNLDATIDDFYPATNHWPRDSATLSREIAPGHTECAGRIRGTIQFNGRTIRVDGLCYRDHSWGRRDWGLMGRHLWIASTFGPQYSFGAIDFEDTRGGRFRDSVCVTSNQVNSTKNFACKCEVSVDTLWLDQGNLRLTLPGGRQLEASYKVIDGVNILHHGYLMADYICECDMGGMQGLFILETGRRFDLAEIPKATSLAAKNGYSCRWK
jgi:hypothetical protein